MTIRRLAWLLALLVAACTPGGSGESSLATVTTEAEAPGTTSAVTSTSMLPAAEGDDLLAFAKGVLLVSSAGIDGNEGVLYQLIDGSDDPVTITTLQDGRVTMVLKLPVIVRFDRLHLESVEDARSGAGFVGRALIEGSVDGPDSGFVELAELQVGPVSGSVTATSPADIPVRWVRVTLTSEGPDDQGRGRFALAEISGYGTEEPLPEVSAAFEGIWDLRLLGRPNSAGDRLELVQDGALVTGCLDTLELRATVNGTVAIGTGIDASSGREAAVVLVADEEGTLAATVAFDNGRFETRFAHPPPRETERQCSLPTSESAVCDAPLYVNFSYDSAEIRTESEAVLDDIHRILVQLGVASVTVVGHTSTEGTDEHNLALSEARAQAVAAELIERGFPAEGISARGVGETEPIVFPDEDEASRSVNRRVELECG